MSGAGVLSVVVPCRNGEAYLAQALRSALDQTRPPDEVLVVDDGSTDRSVGIAEGFGLPVRVLAGPHLGASAARKRGAEAARGERIMFLDADDMLAPTTLEALEAALDAAPDAVALCPWDRYELEGTAWVARPPSNEPRRPGQSDLAAWLSGNWSPPCAVLWSRAAYERSGGWEPSWRVNQDGALMARALARGVRLVRTERGRAYYRRWPDGKASLSMRGRSPSGLAARIDVMAGMVSELEAVGRLRRHRRSMTGALLELRAAVNADSQLVRRCDMLIARAGGTRPWDPPARRLGRLAAVIAAELRDRTRPGPEPLARPTANAPPLETGPLVSVVIPTHNRAHVIARAVQSVLSQTYRNLELLVVDDGSTDQTRAHLAACGDPRLRVLVQDRNRGAPAARNRGIEEARGRYLAFLDSDDAWLPAKLAWQVAALEAAPAWVGFCFTGCETVLRDGRVELHRPEGAGRVFETLLLRNFLHGGGSSVMFRREALAAVGGFDETLAAAEDWDLYQRVAQFYDLVVIDRPLVRIHEDATGPRRSADFRANCSARSAIGRRVRHAQRRAGVEHLYLLDSARRELRSEDGDAWRGRRLVLEALMARPWALEIWPWLGYMLLPTRTRAGMRRVMAAPRQAWRTVHSAR